MARRALPPLNALRAFEAFGRLGSMGAAANELFVTHGAVSRQIRQLEQWLGFKLTEGPKTGLRLTPQADRLLEAVTGAFDGIEMALPVRPAGLNHDLRVACYGTFAIRWLIPRLPDFVARCPQVRLHLREAQGLVDFAAGDVDAAIQIRSGPSDPGLELTPLMTNRYGPVLSPAVAIGAADPASLLAMPRLHTRTWLQAWADWSEATGADLNPDVAEQTYDHFSHALEAAAAGLGVAMAPWIFVADDVLSGRLSAPAGFATLPGHVAFARPVVRRTEAGNLFRAWLLEQSEKMPSAPDEQADQKTSRQGV
jgi:DNA-binding transcriptional LysR family regulator